MEKTNIIQTFNQLSLVLESIGNDQPWSGFHLGITEEEYVNLESIINRQIHSNGWFTKESIRNVFRSWGTLLKKDNLIAWLNNYTFTNEQKRVGIIMAGNIPLVGFHDFISVVLSGNKAIIKLSSDDKTLLPALLGILVQFNPNFSSLFEISTTKLGEIDAIIATGSNNSMNYFESYFGKYPHIFRKNRTSIAILTGEETKEELELLGKDIFTYFGLGCRNVSQIFIPENFKLDLIFEAVYSYNEIINHNKYANNYDYNKAVLLMNREEILDNGFILFKESDALFSPLAMLYYKRYSDQNSIDSFIFENKENIQVIVGKKYTPFGKAQEPEIYDYADNIDTLKWLNSLH